MFSVSRSWYYEKHFDLREAIERIALEFPGYGHRRVTVELHRRGWTVNHKRVLRVMHQESLSVSDPAPFCANHQLGSCFRDLPQNLIKHTELDGLDQAWIADITYA